jgi:hypothetical protein
VYLEFVDKKCLKRFIIRKGVSRLSTRRILMKPKLHRGSYEIKKLILLIIILIILFFLISCSSYSKNELIFLNKQVYTLKSYGGIFFESENKQKYIGGTEVTSGNCQVYVYNITDNVIEDTFHIKGSTSVWSFYEVNERIYFGAINNAALYYYDKKSKSIELLHNFKEKGIYDIAGDNNIIYIGTANDANLYSYNINTKELRFVDSVSSGNFVRSLSYLDGYCYLGIGANAEYIEYNISTKKYKSILFLVQ